VRAGALRALRGLAAGLRAQLPLALDVEDPAGIVRHVATPRGPRGPVEPGESGPDRSPAGVQLWPCVSPAQKWWVWLGVAKEYPIIL